MENKLKFKMQEFQNNRLPVSVSGRVSPWPLRWSPSNPPAVSLQQMKLLNLYIKRAQTSASTSSSSSDISSY